MKLHNGDCLEIMKSIKDKSIDAIITDPPYGTTACKWDSVIPFDLMWEQLDRIIKDNGAIVLFGSEPFSSYLRISNIKNYRYDWVWEKDTPSNIFFSKVQPLKYHENLLVFSKAKAHNQSKNKIKYIPQMELRKEENKRNNKKIINNKSKIFGEGRTFDCSKNTGNKDFIFPKSVKKFNKVRNGLHPTQKPVALMEYLIKTYTNEFETVLDFTMGSGTTGVACCNLNRDFIGIELDTEYFKIAEQRINNLL
jgi:site-specific DNA-methyltransferase (adenine-specific)